MPFCILQEKKSALLAKYVKKSLRSLRVENRASPLRYLREIA
jgi:hypothetical protein